MVLGDGRGGWLESGGLESTHVRGLNLALEAGFPIADLEDAPRRRAVLVLRHGAWPAEWPAGEERQQHRRAPHRARHSIAAMLGA